MNAPTPTRLECLLIADDLTGACDAAVAFAARGAEAEAVLDPAALGPATEVLALSTDTRDFRAGLLAGFMQDLASRAPPAQVIFKKIDSTLRGNAGAEILAVAAAFACDAVLVTPAFPAMRRVVESGYLCVTGQETFAPVDLAAYFRAQGVAACHQVKPWDVETALVWGKRFLSIDAGCEQDLDSIVRAGLGWRRRALFAGSGGLAAALARSLRPRPAARLPLPRAAGPAIFCIGSDHPATLEQEAGLLSCRPAVRLDARAASPDEVVGSLRQSKHVVLRMPREATSPAHVRDLLFPAVQHAAGLLLSGGDTASLVARAMGVDSIRLVDEVSTGIPFALLRGGLLDGRTAVTKSGAFGDADALVRVADFFSAGATPAA
ncbi:MAG: four-carbon acid sugar kinase family protein [Bryobacteraceae bacterium]